MSSSAPAPSEVQRPPPVSSAGVSAGLLSHFGPGVLDYASSPWFLRWALALAAGLVLWSFVGGASYLIVVQHHLPLQVDPLDEARWRLHRGDTNGALREYRQFTAMNPFDTRARSAMGFLLKRAGHLEEAGAAYEEVLRLQPRDAAALTGLADVRLAQARYSEAATLYEAALPLMPGSAVLHTSAGKAHALNGDFARAIEQFDEALALGPDQDAAVNRDRAVADKARLDEPRSGGR